MAEFKVTYFPLGGRAESTRMALAHAKASWEDDRISSEDFGARKAAGEFPNGQLPLLYHKGHVLNESMAILRYVGKHFGYYPEDAFEAWHIDATLGGLGDVMVSVATNTMQKKDFSEAGSELYATTLTGAFEKLNKQLEAHGNPFICGEKITIADFQIMACLVGFVLNDKFPGGALFTDKGKKAIESHAAFASYVARMQGELAEYLAKRPESSI